MEQRQSNVFTLMVDNEFGVLTRITALIRRMGWNIRSLSVAETASPEVSRLTVCLECRHHSLESAVARLEKLDCVQDVSIFSPALQIARELAVLRMENGDPEFPRLMAEEFGAAVLERNGSAYLFQVCGEPRRLDGWLDRLRGLGLREISRTGAVAVDRLQGKGAEQ